MQLDSLVSPPLIIHNYGKTIKPCSYLDRPVKKLDASWFPKGFARSLAFHIEIPRYSYDWLVDGVVVKTPTLDTSVEEGDILYMNRLTYVTLDGFALFQQLCVCLEIRLPG